MATSLSQRAVRSLQRQAQHLITDDGILNAPKILDSVVTLVERATGRARLKTSPQQWAELCRFVEWAYGLGLMTGMFSDLRVITQEPRPRHRAKKKASAR
jgi:hypothetical protein